MNATPCMSNLVLETCSVDKCLSSRRLYSADEGSPPGRAARHSKAG